MSATETTSRIVRIRVTAAEWQGLKVQAVYAEQDLSELVTEALRVSPLTRRAFASHPKEQTAR